jgi:diguanylate cyclase (GGDEF)-like protein
MMRAAGLAGALMAAVVAVAVGLGELRAADRQIQQQVETIARSHVEALAAHLWSVDQDQARLQLAGLLLLDWVEGAEVLETGGASTPWIRVGRLDRPGLEVRQLALRTSPETQRLEGAPPELGALRIAFARDRMRADALWAFARELGIGLLLLSLMGLVLAHLLKRYVTNDLEALADRARRMSLDSPGITFRVRSTEPGCGDEIDQTVEALEGMRVRLEATHAALADSRAALAADFELRERAERALRRAATHDALTGLANRSHFEQQLTRALEAMQSNAGWLAVLSVHGLRRINEGLGKRTGDTVLTAVSARLRAAVPAGDLIARLDGTEFAWLALRSAGQTVPAPETLAELQRALGERIRIRAELLNVQIFIGIRTVETASAQADTLFRDALDALSVAKLQPVPGWVTYSGQLRDQRARQRAVGLALPQALAEDGLRVHFQPIRGPQGQLMGMEALARWTHPELGEIEPGEFIREAERQGQMPALGRAILALALAGFSEFQRTRARQGRPSPEIYVAVNVSVGELVSADFEAGVLEALQVHAVSPRQLVIEITESVLMSDLEGCAQLIARLRFKGVRFFIDDFGTGFSSLAYLQRLPVAGVKIDRSFVSALDRAEADVTIVQAVLSISERFGLVTVAEGIETPAQWECLSRLGCAAFQGYLLGRPAPIAELATDTDAQALPA